MAIKEGHYKIIRNYGGCKGYAVVGAGGVHGCHTTRASAINQQQAIYAAKKAQEAEMTKSWSVVEGHPECEGFAVIGSHGDVKSCHADRASADAALAQHNQNEANGSSDGNDSNSSDDMNKKQYSDKERRVLAQRDMALPDGSFPIVTVADLQNAIQSVGRASNYNKARNHIIRRAEALGRTDLLPEDWKAKKSIFVKSHDMWFDSPFSFYK